MGLRLSRRLDPSKPETHSSLPHTERSKLEINHQWFTVHHVIQVHNHTQSTLKLLIGSSDMRPNSQQHQRSRVGHLFFSPSMRLAINSEGASIESRRAVQANPHHMRAGQQTHLKVFIHRCQLVYTRAMYKHQQKVQKVSDMQTTKIN